MEGKNGTQKELVVPRGLIETVLEQVHVSEILSGGHFAFQKTLDMARQRFWGPNIRNDTKRKCENRTLCQARSTASKRKIDPLQTINVGIRLSKVLADILGLVNEQKTLCKKYTRIDEILQEIRSLHSPGKDCCTRHF